MEVLRAQPLPPAASLRYVGVVRQRCCTSKAENMGSGDGQDQRAQSAVSTEAAAYGSLSPTYPGRRTQCRRRRPGGWVARSARAVDFCHDMARWWEGKRTGIVTIRGGVIIARYYVDFNVVSQCSLQLSFREGAKTR